MPCSAGKSTRAGCFVRARCALAALLAFASANLSINRFQAALCGSAVSRTFCTFGSVARFKALVFGGCSATLIPAVATFAAAHAAVALARAAVAFVAAGVVATAVVRISAGAVALAVVAAAVVLASAGAVARITSAFAFRGIRT